MTEQEWLQSDRPQAMLRGLPAMPGERKLRLFAVACCRHLWNGLPELGRRAVLLAEAYADGTGTARDLQRSQDQVAAEISRLVKNGYPDAPTDPTPTLLWGVRAALGPMALHTVQAQLSSVLSAAMSLKWYLGGPGGRLSGAAAEQAAHHEERAAVFQEESAALARLLRDILGHPFQPPPRAATWPCWQQRGVEELARGIYDDQAFQELPVLADALEEAGCTDPGILNHCREPGVHVRGCWAVDVVLGAE